MAKKVKFFLKRSSKVEIGQKPIIIPFQLITVLLLLAMILISLFLFLRSDLFQIRRIVVTSNIPDCATDEGLKLTTEAIGSSIFFFDLKTAERKILEKFYCLSDAKLSKKYPETLELQVAERQALAAAVEIEEEPTLALATSSAIWQRPNATPSAFLALDKTGILFKNLPNSTVLPKVYIVQDLRLSDQVFTQEILWLLNLLHHFENYNLDFATFLKTTEGVIVGQTLEGKYLLLSKETDVAKTAASLQAILRQAKIEDSQFSILDLRFQKPVLK